MTARVPLPPETKHVEMDPDRHSGDPVIRGRRVPAYIVAELASTPEGVLHACDSYNLTRAEVHGAREWWGGLTEEQRHLLRRGELAVTRP